MRPTLLPFIGALCSVSAQNGFVSPKYEASTQPGRFSGNSLWELGSSHIVAFQSSWDEYRIELWQQVDDSRALLSSNLVYDQNSGDRLPQSFYWTVQTYELQLSDSPVFFFWLRDNNSEDQQSSAFFNITVASTSSSSNTIVVSTKVAPTSITITPIPGTTVSSAATTALAPSLPAAETSSVGESNGVSTGATAGISVGVSLATISAVALAGYMLYKRRKRRGTDMQTPEYSYGYVQNKTVPTTETDGQQQELEVHGRTSPAELAG